MGNLKIQRVAFIAELTEFISEREDMSLSEILYSFLRSTDYNGSKLSAILNFTDKELLQKIEMAKKIENE